VGVVNGNWTGNCVGEVTGNLDENRSGCSDCATGWEAE